jgi:hypothetical protein
MNIYRILNVGQCIRREARRRIWLDMGVPMVVAPNTTMTLRADRVDDKYYVTFALRGVADTPLVDAAVPMTTWTNLTAICPRVMLPRAVRYDDSVRPAALLMEFVLLDAEIPSLAAARV